MYVTAAAASCCTKHCRHLASWYQCLRLLHCCCCCTRLCKRQVCHAADVNTAAITAAALLLLLLLLHSPLQAPGLSCC
jgi:hypothetical protein